VNGKSHSGGDGILFGVERSGLRVASLLWLAVDEGGAFSDKGDELDAGDLAPASPGWLEQLVGHFEPSLVRTRSPGHLDMVRRFARYVSIRVRLPWSDSARPLIPTG